MVTISILIFIAALALPFYLFQVHINLNEFNDNLIYPGTFMSLNALYIQSIGSGIGIVKRSMSTTYKPYWKHFEYDLGYDILDDDTLEKSLSQFWFQIMDKLDENILVSIQFKVKIIYNIIENEDPMIDTINEYRIVSISHLQKARKTDYNDILTVFLAFLDIKAEDYASQKMTHIIYSYHILDDSSPIEKKMTKELNLPKNVKKTPMFRFKGYNFPPTTDHTQWGMVMTNSDNYALISKKNSKLSYSIEKMNDKHKVTLMYLTRKIIIFEDCNIQNHNTFIRKIANQELHYVNGEIVFKTIQRSCSFMKKGLIDINFKNNNIFTLDIETRTINNNMIPFCICIYDGKNSTSFYLSDYKDSQTMMKHAIMFLIKSTNHLSKIYIHNLSNFDGIFLISVLASIPNTTLIPIMKDDRIYNLRLQWQSDKPNKKGKYFTYYIDFRDSLLMLPLSLRKLAKFFDVSNKSYYPYLFLNDNSIPLTYEGIIPDYHYFEKIDKSDYNQMKKDNPVWSLKKATIDYCNQDCISLYQVISKFAILVYDKWKLNIHKNFTLPALALRLWYTHYLKNSEVSIITGQIHNDIRKGYTGGHTDMYIPYGQNLNQYDINSLYPSSMLLNDMPVGKPIYFEGDVTQFRDNPFGFFEVTVTTPKDMDRPILQTKIKTPSGYRTVAPLGTWSDVIFSEEMYNAMKYGYTFQVHRGYLFEKQNLFDKFIHDLYTMRLSYAKSDPMNLICKLLMNSCYGKFGQQLILPSHVIVDEKMMDDMVINKKLNNISIDRISNTIELLNNKFLVCYYLNEEDQFIQSHGYLNIGIASAITAYSRMTMSHFLVNPKLQLYYTDTDCIVMKDELDPRYVGKNLGQFKLENNYQEGIFLAPKVYGGITQEGKDFSKVKGYKHSVSFNELKSLLFKDQSLDLKHDLWLKNIGKGLIQVKNRSYKLIATGNKRHLIYHNNELIATKPFTINAKKEIVS